MLYYYPTYLPILTTAMLHMQKAALCPWCNSRFNLQQKSPNKAASQSPLSYVISSLINVPCSKHGDERKTMRTALFSSVAMAGLAFGWPIAHAQAAPDAEDEQRSPIIVTASGLGQTVDEAATPVVTLSGEDLVHRRQATLGDTLSGQPGINFDNFGGGASRPVIRGPWTEPITIPQRLAWALRGSARAAISA